LNLSAKISTKIAHPESVTFPEAIVKLSHDVSLHDEQEANQIRKKATKFMLIVHHILRKRNHKSWLGW
jgi:hypothetical protein